MDNASLFRLLLPVMLVVFILHRGYYTRRYAESDADTLKKRSEGLATKFSALLGFAGLLGTSAYAVFPSWIAWASAPLPAWLRWTGVVLALLGFGLLQWAQSTLGKNWSDTPRMMKEQALIVDGPYRWVRHPIYTAFLLILGSTFLISANWLIGACWFGMTLLEIASRIRYEEALMLEYFGDRYQSYMNRTGLLLPRLIRL